jgi:hypothetical protein
MGGAVKTNMPMEQHGRCAAKTGRLTVAGGLQPRWASSQHSFRQLFLYVRFDHLPGRRNLSGDQDQLRRKCGGNKPKAASKLDCLLGSDLDGSRIALLRQPEQLIDISDVRLLV